TSANNGNCLVQRDTLDVSIIAAPTADFSSITACAGKPIPFTDKSTPAADVSKWSWNFGDASVPVALKNPVHTYIQGGTYPVTLIATSKNGCTDTVTKNISIPHNPIANFTTTGICLKDGVQFTDSSFVTASSIVKWNWFFGDNKTDSLKNPLHYFPSAGTYNNLLVVTSVEGCIDSVEKKLIIAKGPKADFT